MRGSLAAMLASAPGFFRAASSEVVEVSTVSNVAASATAWDLRAAADGGCGLAGCGPSLAKDGLDNTVPDSRWSCEPGMDTTGDCSITFTLDDGFVIDHVVLYIHESDTAQVSIPVVVQIGGYYSSDSVSDLTSTGTPLGEGQQINIPSSFESAGEVLLDFTLTNGQYISLSEVEIFVDVDNPDDYVVIPSAEVVVEATSVTNVVASAYYWNLDSDAGCGKAGCTPGLVTDGQDNTVAGSRWSCQVEDDYVESSYDYSRCQLTLTMDDSYQVSYIIVYVHESDDPTKEALVFTAGAYPNNEPFQTTPGTPLGTGERFNLPPTTSTVLFEFSNLTAGQIIEISEIEIYVEVTDTSVLIAAAEAWTNVTAETLTPVTTLASESLNDTSAEATRDGDDNTVATSLWSCDGSEWGYCVLFFEFSDEFTVSSLDLYMHQSADAAAEPVYLEICNCYSVTSLNYPGFNCRCLSDYEDPVGTYVTKPGTPLGQPERVNLLNPLTSGIGIVCANLTASGGMVSISEVDIFFQVPDSTPTPAPFVDETPAPTTSSRSITGLYSGSTTSSLPGATTSFSPGTTTSSPVGTITTSSSLGSTTTGLEGGGDDDGDTTSGGDEYGTGDDDTPAGSIPSATPSPADATNDLDLLGSGGARTVKDGLWMAVGIGGSLLVMAVSATAV